MEPNEKKETDKMTDPKRQDGSLPNSTKIGEESNYSENSSPHLPLEKFSTNILYPKFSRYQIIKNLLKYYLLFYI